MSQQALKIEEQAPLLSISAIAKKCGIDRATARTRLDQLGYEPEVEKAKEKLYRFDDEMEFAVKAAKDTVSAMKVRDLLATARLKELKLAKEAGELVPIGEVTEIVQAIVSNVFQEYTIRQPKRIGGQLVKAKNIAEVKKALKSDSDRIMRSLRANFENFIDGQNG